MIVGKYFFSHPHAKKKKQKKKTKKKPLSPKEFFNDSWKTFFSRTSHANKRENDWDDLIWFFFRQKKHIHEGDNYKQHQSRKLTR